MKRLGVVENVAYDGSVLVRSAFLPSLGTRVVDKRQRALGRIVKVFGPAKEPFASVRPDGKVPLSLLGSEVYVSEVHDGAKEDRRGRRSH
jgi:rRNA processing protein Gar1